MHYFSILCFKYVNIDSKVFSDKIFKIYPSIKVLTNVVFLIEVILVNLRIFHNLSPEIIKQNSKTHRILIKYLSTPPMRFFFAVVSIFYTIPYSGEFKVEKLVKSIIRYSEGDLKGARLARIALKKGMSELALDKVIKGAILSIKGNVSTHPIYYANKVQKYYDINFEDCELKDLMLTSTFPQSFNQAVDIIIMLFQDKTLIDLIFKTNALEDSLGIIRDKHEWFEGVPYIPEDASDDPEELEYIKRFNNKE